LIFRCGFFYAYILDAKKMNDRLKTVFGEKNCFSTENKSKEYEKIVSFDNSCTIIDIKLIIAYTEKTKL
ncbi:MAG: hypothetical protein IKU80_02940, partial [Firmicutes bacterium]|nr:hypothetical protein [Bacillota bacterium]